jgi:hypothetical protein
MIASVTSGFRLSFYDALYVALAEREGCDLIAGDDKLVRNLATDYPFIRSLSSVKSTAAGAKARGELQPASLTEWYGGLRETCASSDVVVPS